MMGESYRSDTFGSLVRSRSRNGNAETTRLVSVAHPDDTSSGGTGFATAKSLVRSLPGTSFALAPSDRPPTALRRAGTPI